MGMRPLEETVEVPKPVGVHLDLWGVHGHGKTWKVDAGVPGPLVPWVFRLSTRGVSWRHQGSIHIPF